MKRDSKRSILSLMQATVDIAVSYSLWVFQLGSLIALFLFLIMGGTLVLQSWNAFEKSTLGVHPSKASAKDEDDNSTTSPSEVETTSVKNDGEALRLAFEGFEFLLFAPLSFLLLRSLTRYVVDLSLSEVTPKVTIRNPEPRFFGKRALFETKVLSVGLLFAIVATHMVGKFLAGKYGGPNVDGREMLVGMGLLVGLAVAYLLMERLSHRNN